MTPAHVHTILPDVMIEGVGVVCVLVIVHVYYSLGQYGMASERKSDLEGAFHVSSLVPHHARFTPVFHGVCFVVIPMVHRVEVGCVLILPLSLSVCV